MSDRRYSTARWQRLRKAVLAHCGYVCQIQGPRCIGVADTVHHILPSSQYPELFWDPDNLEAACRPCNFGDGALVKAENSRSSRERIAELEWIVQVQEARIVELAQALARYYRTAITP